MANEKQPADYCDTPQENYPYRDETFAVIKRLAGLIKTVSRQHNVPPIAVAGSIADEFNTRQGVKKGIDWFQDSLLIGEMPNSFIEFDVWIGANSKWLNATKHDIGIGNIKLETAKQMYDQHKKTFKRQDLSYADLVDYILTDKGTVHIAALVIKKAKSELDGYIRDYPPEVKEAVYVTYYKQGPSYVQRFRNALVNTPDHQLRPGEGCRVLLQRQRFQAALGVD
jgi:hypothetical protein